MRSSRIWSKGARAFKHSGSKCVSTHYEKKTIDAMEDVNAYIKIIKENIEYDRYMKYGD